jgi:hypothetical protein
MNYDNNQLPSSSPASRPLASQAAANNPISAAGMAAKRAASSMME